METKTESYEKVIADVKQYVRYLKVLQAGEGYNKLQLRQEIISCEAMINRLSDIQHGWEIAKSVFKE